MNETNTLLPNERLIADRLALDFHAQVVTLARARGLATLRDQLLRAADSIVLNIAEGASRQSPADKRRFYAIARGSVGEVGAALDLLLIRHRISAARHSEIHTQIVCVARLLGGLCRSS